MDIVHYLEPYKGGRNCIPGIGAEESVAANISFYTGGEEWFRQAAHQITIIGVPEARNGTGDNRCACAPDEIRKWLYAHRRFNSGLSIADAGNVRGKSLNDRYRALQDVVGYFTNLKSTVVVLGGSQDLSLPVFKALTANSERVNLVAADALLDVDAANEDFSARS